MGFFKENIDAFKFLIENRPEKISDNLENENTKKIVVIGQLHMSPNESAEYKIIREKSQNHIYYFLRYFQKNNLTVGDEGVIEGKVVDEKYYIKTIGLNLFSSVTVNGKEVYNGGLVTEKDLEKGVEILSDIEKRNLNSIEINFSDKKIKLEWENEEEMEDLITFKVLFEEYYDNDYQYLINRFSGLKTAYSKDNSKIKIIGVEKEQKDEEIGNIKISELNVYDIKDEIYKLINDFFFIYIKKVLENGNLDEEEKKGIKLFIENEKYVLSIFDGDLDSDINDETKEKMIKFYNNSKIIRELMGDLKKSDIFGQNGSNEKLENLKFLEEKYSKYDKEFVKTLLTYMKIGIRKQNLEREDNALKNIVSKSGKNGALVYGAGHLESFKDRINEFHKNNPEKNINFYILDLSFREELKD